MIKNYHQFLNEAKIVSRGYFGPDGVEYYIEQHGKMFTVIAKSPNGPASEAWDDEFANIDDAIETAKGLADGTLDESLEPLNEDYAQQAAINQERVQKTMERIEGTKRRVMQLDERTQSYKEKASKTKDDVSKGVYAAKISSNNARKESYMAYMTYLQTMNTFYQTKGKEIETRSKASEKRKL
jgi:hypothetical protein